MTTYRVRLSIQMACLSEEKLMATPTSKSPVLEALLENAHGRTSAIRSDVCIREPVGCGGEATEFRDALSRREYKINGLCQECQDSVFGEGE